MEIIWLKKGAFRIVGYTTLKRKVEEEEEKEKKYFWNINSKQLTLWNWQRKRQTY